MNYYFYEFYEKLRNDNRFSSLNGKLIETRRKVYRNRMELEEKELVLVFRVKPNNYRFEKIISFSLIHIVETKETYLIVHIKGKSYEYKDINYKDITNNIHSEINGLSKLNDFLKIKNINIAQ